MGYSVRPTGDGGRKVIIDTPHLAATIVDGNVIEWTPREPPMDRSSGQVSRIGDDYKWKLSDTFGGMPCNGCEAERRRLNQMTADQVRAEFDAIVEATIERAKKSQRWWDRVRVKFGEAAAPGTLRDMIGDCLEWAIEERECPDGA